MKTFKKTLLLKVLVCLFIIIMAGFKVNTFNKNYDNIYTNDKLDMFLKDFNNLHVGMTNFFIEYADENRIIFRNYAYLIEMKPTNDSWIITSALDLRPINAFNIQGENYTKVHVTSNGSLVNIQNSSFDEPLSPLYQYDLNNYTLNKKENTLIPDFEPNESVFLDKGVFNTYDGLKFKYEDRDSIIILNEDNTIKNQFDLDVNNSDLAYVGNNIFVQIAYPKNNEQDQSICGYFRLISYNAHTGELSEQLITQGL